ncbi:MAG: glycoside hydrolase family 16 protein [Clostridia bacterium]|nr:glycoside hydrolase family 16 protein [Clostridia bacterium]
MKQLLSKISVLLVLTLVFCVVFTSCNKDESPASPEPLSFKDYIAGGGTLLWSDEFDGTEINKDNWMVMGEDYPVADHGGYWIKDNVTVSDGYLKISAFFDGDYFYAGAINSQGRYPSKYGYYEIRCRLPEYYGLWSAFWMLPEDGAGYQSDENMQTKNTDKYGAEIDIFEAPFSPANQVQHTLHIGGDRGIQTFRYSNIETEKDEDNFYNSFHTYGLYWDENTYVFFIDGEVMWATDYDAHVSHAEEYLCVTLQAGGHVENGVPVTGHAFSTPWLASPEDPRNVFSDDNSFIVDYVRHYDLYDGPDAIPTDIDPGF